MSQDAAIQPIFATLDDFVREFLVLTYRRKVGPTAPYHWDARWWEYPEAVVRLDGVWRAWEKLRLDPGTGIGNWFRDYADPAMAILLSDSGPFRKSSSENEQGDPLPYEAPPAGLFSG